MALSIYNLIYVKTLSKYFQFDPPPHCPAARRGKQIMVNLAFPKQAPIERQVTGGMNAGTNAW